MKSKRAWMLACKPNNDVGRWHIAFAGETFPSFSQAADQAIDYMTSGGGMPYLYRPVLVEITPLEDFEKLGET